MKESFESKIWRWFINLHPTYRGSGGRITFISADFCHVKIKLPCHWKTKNHMGITWGGSLYAALDPIYGIMLHKLLRGKYKVIDRSAHIHFKNPGRETLYAHFHIPKQELQDIKTELKTHSRLQRTYQVSLQNRQGKEHVCCDKVIGIYAKPKPAALQNELST